MPAGTKGHIADGDRACKMCIRDSSGMSILLISHDVEFCAELSCRCLMLFDGKIVFDGPGAALFADNRFYTTAAARIDVYKRQQRW